MRNLTCIMPVKNREDYVAEAIQSILDQTFADFELLIVEDGSTDGTPAIVDAFAKADPRIRIIQGPSQGIAAAMNAGLAACDTRFVARMDSDDVCMPERFALQIERLQNDETLVGIGGWSRTIDAQGRPTGKLRENPEDPDVIAHNLMHGRFPFTNPTMMFRKEAIHRVGGHRSCFAVCEDLDLDLRLSEIGRFANVPSCLLSYRMHEAQITREKLETMLFEDTLARYSANRRRSGQSDPLNVMSHRHDFASIPDAAMREDLQRLADYTSLRARINQTDGFRRQDLVDIDVRELVKHVLRTHPCDNAKFKSALICKVALSCFRAGFHQKAVQLIGASIRNFRWRTVSGLRRAIRWSPPLGKNFVDA